MEALTVTDVLSRGVSGQPVSRSVLSLATLAAAAVAPARQGCLGKALASPVFDDGKLIAIGNQAFGPTVKDAWAQLGFRPGPLDDAVVVETGEFQYARFLLFVPARFVVPQVILVAASDASDNFGDQHIVTSADQVPPGSLPASWTDASGPWRNDTFLVSGVLAYHKDYVAVVVTVKGSGGKDRVQIGATPATREVRGKLTFRPFYIAAIEVLRKSEATRSDYDQLEQTKKQGVLANALGLDSADDALLAANQTYQVRVTYDAERQKRPVGGGGPTDIATAPGQVQSFWFQTDAAAPAKLDPWILVGWPSEAEQHFFADDPVKVVFATNNLNLLYDAYGKKLQARLRPANFRPVTPPPGIPHPFPLDATTLKPVKASVLSPWEDAVQDLASSSLPCVPVKGDRVRHTMITIPIPLDLYTDYILDIEMLDKAAADGSPGTRVYRESFSTGGFRTLDDFAKSFMIARAGHRGVHSGNIGALQAIGTKYASHDPQGSEFDTDWQTSAGMNALPVPKAPRVTILWEPGAPDPQPVALLIDGSEPMWRYRPVPTEVSDAGLAAARRYELVPTAWLRLSEQSGGDAIVDHIVPTPGAQRALVTLKPFSRGKHLRLALRRVAFTQPYLDGSAATDQFFSIVDLTLDRAPWEETD
jgi:hypothetical protein